MAAYAALVSVMQIIHQIENHHSPPISLDKQQVESLTEKVNLLQEFLEGYDSPFGYSDEADPLEMRIADAAYAAEDVIESYIVDSIKLVVQTTHHDAGVDADDADADADDDDEVKDISFINFCEDVQKVIDKMDLITREVTQMVGEKGAVEAQLHKNFSRDAGGFGSISERKSVMVGFEDLLLQLLDRLTGRESSRQIIPIVGMGGIGKTTLAINVFEHRLIKEHFDICVWVTISQDYNIRETLAQLLSQARGNSVDRTETELGEKLHRILCGTKYLVVLDDMWSIEVWDKIKFFLPEYNNGSRILVTTRLSSMATHLTHPNSLLNVSPLDEVSSWNLFSKTVFGEESFPAELKEIGKKIENNCNGHPLAIVVVGGLLAKSQRTKEHWEHIEKNLVSIVNSENEEYCLRILRLSYNHLPVYVKPCFLYMGVFEEDRLIRASRLMKLWICEGFVKLRNNKTLETVAEEYLKELVDRNLIIVEEVGVLGNIKYCRVHDLLRDLSLREARKQRLFYEVRHKDRAPGIESHRRITIRKSATIDGSIGDVFESCPHARSILGDESQAVDEDPDLRLLRIHSTINKTPWGSVYSLEEVFLHVNSRYLALLVSSWDNKIPSSINLLWNLHTLIISSDELYIAPIEIWKMHQLRHVVSSDKALYLPDPPSGDNDNNIIILENLQTLKVLYDLNLNEQVVKRIPNVKALHVGYDGERIERVDLSYLECLTKLETFVWQSYDRGDEFLHNISFPKSLKKLKIVFYKSKRRRYFSSFKLEGILQKIGSLPLLEKLELEGGVFATHKWETMEGQFPRLKVLKLSRCRDLENWIVSESSHFPLLRELHLSELEHLEEIPSEMGEIATLKSIVLEECSDSVAVSAKKIVDEQEELQGDQPVLHVVVVYQKYRQVRDLEHLASPNFHFHHTSLSFSQF